jgi:hypothetical protein
MTRLVMQYTISITEEPQFAHESFEQRKERVMRSYQGISLTYVLVLVLHLLFGRELIYFCLLCRPYRTPLTFTRR